VRATKPGLLESSQGRRPRPPSFSDAPRDSLRSGDTRRAARRPLSMTPVLVLPACAGLPSRDASESALLTKSKRARVEGPSKDASHGACDDFSCLRPVPTLGERKPTAFPSSASFRHPRSSARSFAAVEPLRPNHEPTKVLVPTTPREERRLPENRDAFHHHDTRRNWSRGEVNLSGLRAGSPAHAAHTVSPGWGECLERALRVSRCGHPRSVTVRPQTIREYRRL